MLHPKKKTTLVLAAVASAVGAMPAMAQLRAFGEAEGYGAVASGGRGGTIYHVTIELGKYNNIDAVSGNAPHITIQHSIIADPISTGTSTRGQGFGAHLEAADGYYTLSNNLWANSHSRNPLAKVNEQFKNNV